ncbi:homocysteine S-methyltransferase [Pacificimonas flava]|uniref:Homocysteine S-methyltransferase n=2 Tax=Pacificimonas TaxID=1960290 RepID=A0A219B314_9SPHN|nr:MULTISPECIES: homocysteine S-methyltransferase family protein [Pacificimonas]MBZ6377544.1 homocysteine S-methyltransferase family protein [Pacificimonas aurantium]OWV32762.1 homocysteine S-methyltransferase [Pacificimonas flava]
MLNFDQTIFLTDGGIETSLIYRQGMTLPHFSAVMLMDGAEGRAALERYFRPYLDIAAREGTGFILESPTWRASPDWTGPLGITAAHLETLNEAAMDLMQALAAEYRPRIDRLYVSGCVGPCGDGYDPGAAMTPAEAADYHGFQARIFARKGADLLTAITMTNSAEAQGVARAAHAAGLPSVIAFTVETDGRLPTGEPLAEAIASVDAAGEAAPLHYMINCAHPDHFTGTLRSGADEGWTRRIRGLRSNASRLSHAELDAAEELDAGDPAQLGSETAQLAGLLASLTVFGGCCGTDERHIAQMAGALRAKQAA